MTNHPRDISKQFVPPAASGQELNLVDQLREAIYDATYGYKYKRERIFELLDKVLNRAVATEGLLPKRKDSDD